VKKETVPQPPKVGGGRQQKRRKRETEANRSRFRVRGSRKARDSSKIVSAKRRRGEAVS